MPLALVPSSRGRYWLMQLCLWLVLGGTLGLAMLLQRHFRHVQQVELSGREQFGALSVSGPAGWTKRRTAEGVVFEEPGEGRTLQVWRGHTRVFMSPLEYLIRSRDLTYREAAAALAGGPDAEHRPLRAISIASWPGILVSQTRVEGGGPGRVARHVVACAVLPSFDVIIVRLIAGGAATAADEDLVARVAKSVALKGCSSPAPSSTLEFEDAIRIKVPAALRAMAGRDPFRESRTLMLADDPDWLAVDVLPCLFLEGDGPQTLLSVLNWRDPQFRAGRIKQIDANTWMCARREDSLLPAVAYLRRSGDGRAVLAEFRCVRPAAASGSDEVWIDGLWKALANGIEFGRSSARPVDLVLAGEEAVAQLPQDLASMISEVAEQGADEGGTIIGESKSRWYQEDLPEQTAYTTSFRADARSVQGSVIMEHSPPLSDGPQERCTWRISRDPGPIRYEYAIARPGEGLWQLTRVADGQWETVIGQTIGVGAQLRGVLPANYIPGALLHHALGFLPPQRMVLSTESIIDPGSAASMNLLRICIEPADDLPKTLANVQPPQKLRCWKIHVNGASTSSRWYLDSAGELQSISFSGQVRLQKRVPEEHD